MTKLTATFRNVTSAPKSYASYCWHMHSFGNQLRVTLQMGNLHLVYPCANSGVLSTADTFCACIWFLQQYTSQLTVRNKGTAGCRRTIRNSDS